MATLTGPENCAECGTGLTVEIVLNGDAGPFALTLRGHRIEIPGLYVCTNCAGAIMVGERESTVTLEAAREFLNDIMGPAAVNYLLTNADDLDDSRMALERLTEVMGVQELLEACIILLWHDPAGLDFIPECTGTHDTHTTHAHPRDNAHLN